MPADNPSDSDRSEAGGDTRPEPGHFLPGGTGDVLTDSDAAAARPLTGSRRQSVGLGKARDISGPDPALRRVARPLPTDPNATGEYSGPPAAPMAGAPLTPLTGTRRTGGSRPVGWHSNPSRTGAQFTTEAPPVKPPRHYSRAVIAGLSALVLVMLTGATIAGFKLIDSYGNPVDNPMSRPSVKKSEVPLPVPPDPTHTVTVAPVPDMVRLQKNKLYTAGKVPAVGCKEPSIEPTSEVAILKYYQALLPCFNTAWKPLVEKAGYPFRPAKVQLVSKANTSTCTGEPNSSYYCGADETISMDWKDQAKSYAENPAFARVLMMNTFAHEYGHHVQMLTNILISSDSREGWTKSKAGKQEWSRRLELQAFCLGSAFLGANKQGLGIRGEKLRLWEYAAKNIGDENDPKTPPDHGSRASTWYWSGPAFKSTNPASCNTYSAPSNKVS